MTKLQLQYKYHSLIHSWLNPLRPNAFDIVYSSSVISFPAQKKNQTKRITNVQMQNKLIACCSVVLLEISEEAKTGAWNGCSAAKTAFTYRNVHLIYVCRYFVCLTSGAMCPME